MNTIEQLEQFVAGTPAEQVRARYDSTGPAELGDLIAAIQTHIALGRLPELEAMFPEFAHCNPDNFERFADGFYHYKATRLAFKAICKKHLKTNVADSDFEAHRYFAVSEPRPFWPMTEEELAKLFAADKDAVIDLAMTESGVNLKDIGFRSESIGTLNGAPIVFFKKEGIYAYQESADCGFILEVWLTCPAYPKGW